MSYNDYMYAVDRSDEYLAHYGIKGMRWGVRRALASGNERRLAKHYARAQKKLAKLKKQAKNADKYSKRAKRLGAAAAVTGGLAVAGPEGIANATRGISAFGRNLPGKLRNISDKVLATELPGTSTMSNVLEDTASRVTDLKGKGYASRLDNAAGAIDKWGKSHSITRSVDSGLTNLGTVIQARNHHPVGSNAAKMQTNLGMGAWKTANTVRNANLTNSQIARAGAAAVSAGLAGAAGYNAYKAATAKKKAAKFERAMNETFANTKYGRRPKKRNHRRG